MKRLMGAAAALALGAGAAVADSHATEIKLGVIAVPATAAQEVAQQLVEAGMEGILNFAPVTLNLEEDVGIVSVDLAIELEQLTFAVVNRRKNA